MRILVLSNLFPPHQAGTEDFRCESTVTNLRVRGHEVHVLTSMHGSNHERMDGTVGRRLMLNGAFGYPLLTGLSQIKPLEIHNHAVLLEALERYTPDLVLVFSLRGLSKSLVFGLHHARLPVVYDVADHWIAHDLRQDPWLRWWNHPGGNSFRAFHELTGQRAKLDAVAPTRPAPGCDRLPEVYATADTTAAAPPNSISVFRFDHVYFCSLGLKETTEHAGYKVSHGEVIPVGIAVQTYSGEVKPPSAPLQKLLYAGRIHKGSGVLTAVQALKSLRNRQVRVSLSIYGKGDSNAMAEIRSFVALHRLPVDFLPVSHPQRDLPGVLRQHDCLLHTAEQAEPYFLTPLQAMACGLPVIGTPVGGAREVLRDGENALTFQPADAEGLASRIEQLCCQPALRCQIAEAGQTETLRFYNETVIMDRIESLLETARQMWQAG